MQSKSSAYQNRKKNPTQRKNAKNNRVVERGFTGLNVDFEPTASAKEQDAIDYANFLTLFADRLHQHGKKLTVDVATWNLVWNWTLLSHSSVDKIMLMSTYTGNFTYFQKDLALAVQQIGIEKLVSLFFFCFFVST